MALLDFDAEKYSARGYFCSEGVFNGAASVMMVGALEIVLVELQYWLAEGGFSVFSQGEVGELIDRILLVHSALTAKRHGIIDYWVNSGIPPKYITIEPETKKSLSEQIFEPVSLEDFLNVYAGKLETEAYLDEHTALRGSFVAFSHFVYMGGDDLSEGPYDVAANLLSRGAALATITGTFIPLVLNDGRISFIYVQTKLGKWMNVHPSAAEVAFTSPENRLRLLDSLAANKAKRYLDEGSLAAPAKSRPNESQVPPYCFIYRQFSNTANAGFKIYPSAPIPQKEGVRSPVIHHQPCLSLIGFQAQTQTSTIASIIECFCTKNDHTWLQWNDSIKKVWKVPKMTLEKPLDCGEFDIPVSVDVTPSVVVEQPVDEEGVTVRMSSRTRQKVQRTNRLDKARLCK